MSYHRILLGHAMDQHGFVTTRDADELAVPAVEMRKMAARGTLTHVGHGLYRVPEVHPTNLDQFAEAVLRVGPGAFLTHDAVLAVNNIALVNPNRIRVGTPNRIRSKLPHYIQVIHRQLPDADLTYTEGIPTTTVRRALLDCRGLVMDGRLLDALKDSERQGLVTRREAVHLREIFRRPATTDTAAQVTSER